MRAPKCCSGCVTTKARKAPRQTVVHVVVTVVVVEAVTPVVVAVEAVVGPDNPTPWVTVPAVDRAQHKAVAVTVAVVVVAMAVAAEAVATAPARPKQPRASLTPCAPVST